MSRTSEQLARLRDPAFSRLWARARSRIEREPDAVSVGRVQLSDPDEAERRAVSGLIGRAFRGRTVSVRLAEVDDALVRSPLGRGLVEVLELLGGPLRDRGAERAAREAAIAAALERAGRSGLAAEAWFRAWVDALASGALTRLYNEERLGDLAVAVAVLEALPASDVPIAVFASRTAGHAKALDGTPVERMVLQALALREGVERPSGASARRELWERVGVVPDDLASQVLVLGLRPVGEGLIDGFMRASADAGLPLRVTLQQLTSCPPVFDGRDVFVCENPAVLRAAAERGGAALVCTEGWPSVACVRLLAAIAQAGGVVRVHADFDAAGVEIVGALVRRVGARPWRFDAESYVDAAGRVSAGRLSGGIPETGWDPGLQREMEGRRVFVEEEGLVGVLVGDLGSG